MAEGNTEKVEKSNRMFAALSVSWGFTIRVQGVLMEVEIWRWENVLEKVPKALNVISSQVIFQNLNGVQEHESSPNQRWILNTYKNLKIQNENASTIYFVAEKWYNITEVWKYLMLCYAKSLRSCPTLCDPIERSPPGSPVPGILQARTLEWVAISFSNAWKGKVKVKLLSRVRLWATPWTAAYQAPPSMGFSRQEYWSGVPLPSLIY